MARKNWTQEAGAVETFARFCAPTALAKLLDISKQEAARKLLDVPNLPSTRVGWVTNSGWDAFLVRLGGRLIKTRRSKEEVAARWKARVERWREKVREWEQGQRRNYPNHPQSRAHNFPTVAEWLREHPKGWFILHVAGHTLAAHDGRVVADTRRTKSRRARVESAIYFSDERVAALRKEEELRVEIENRT